LGITIKHGLILLVTSVLLGQSLSAQTNLIGSLQSNMNAFFCLFPFFVFLSSAWKFFCKGTDCQNNIITPFSFALLAGFTVLLLLACQEDLLKNTETGGILGVFSYIATLQKWVIGGDALSSIDFTWLIFNLLLALFLFLFSETPTVTAGLFYLFFILCAIISKHGDYTYILVVFLWVINHSFGSTALSRQVVGFNGQSVNLNPLQKYLVTYTRQNGSLPESEALLAFESEEEGRYQLTPLVTSGLLQKSYMPDAGATYFPGVANNYGYSMQLKVWSGIRCLFIVFGFLTYLISPVDLIPDVFVPFGFADDAGLAYYAWGWLKNEWKIIMGPTAQED
jgi:hypothetical protein